MKKNLILFFFFLITIYSFPKTNAFILSNDNYFKIFPEEKEIYNLLKNKLNSRFKVLETKYYSFDSLPNELNKLTSKYPDGLFVLNDFLSPYLIKSKSINGIEKYKLLTYNIMQNINAGFPVFNILVDSTVFEKEIIRLSKKYSNKKDFSDCGLVIDSNNLLCNDVVSLLSKDNFKFTINNSADSPLNWINANKNLKSIIFFAFKGNLIISQIDNKELQKINYIEIFTDYGEKQNFIKHRIAVDWKRALNIAIDSKDFSEFIKPGTSNILKNYIIKENVLIDKK